SFAATAPEAMPAAYGSGQLPPVRPNQTPNSAASATIARKPFNANSSARGRRRTSGRGGGVPGYSSRQTAAAKQKAANPTSPEPVSTTTHSGSTPPSVFFAPTPAASDISPVRIQAA